MRRNSTDHRADKIESKTYNAINQELKVKNYFPVPGIESGTPG
jgi:hypothetical protein